LTRRRLLIVSSGRADVGGLAAIWNRAADDDRIELHVALTGRHAPEALLAAADLVTEMRSHKHPFERGEKAQPGIDY
jgi:ATP:corrinoid adenosyltransferase